jgi:hypothetical protein
VPRTFRRHFFAVIILFYAAHLPAQDAPSKYEVGGQFPYFRLHAASDDRFGLGTRFTYNFTDLFSLDTEYDITPSNKTGPKSDFVRGRTGEFFAGAKIGGRKPRLWRLHEAAAGA